MGLCKSDIPPELLDRIFERCQKNRGYKTFVPQSHLHPLLLVCKNWHGVAERRLYRSISIGSDRAVQDKNGDEKVILGRDLSRRLCETVENNVRISSFVRDLNLGCECIRPDESEIHVRIIRACRNVESINLRGCDASILDDLKAALAKSDLTSLVLWGTSLQDDGDFMSGESRPMLALSEILTLLPNWPRLETISVVTGHPRDEDGYAHIETSDLEGLERACPALRYISIRDGSTFYSRDLAFLAHIAPNLEVVHIFIGLKCSDVLRACLGTWSSSLQGLYVNTYAFYYSDEVPPNFSPVFTPSMAELLELTWLDTSAPLFTVNALALLPKLENLAFTRGTYTQCMELAQLIEKGKMPSLRKLEMSLFEFNGNPPTDDEREARERRELEVGKELRRVCKPRNIFYKDFFTSVEELEEHNGYDEEICSEASDD